MAHYHKCAAYYDEQARRTGLDYLGLGVGIQFRQLAADEIPAVLNPAYFPAVIETSEYSVDARAIASMLRDAVVAHPGIIPYTDHEVTGIEENRDGSLNVTMLHDGSRVRDKFPAVVNATWHRRLPLDRPMGITPRGSWSHRYKFGHRINICLEARDVPSVTGVLGPFGDLVNFGNGGLYLSWYPTSRTGMSSEEVPPDWDAQYDREQRMAVFHASVAEWKRRCGLLDKLRFEESEVDPDGGVIYALGTTDVDDHASRLHARFDVGIQSRGRYHSVDTGKYTLMPYLGVAVADRLQGIR
jgi:hypothetical protein